MTDDDGFEATISHEDLARFDQAFAGSVTMLRELVASYGRERAEHEAAGYPEAVTVLSLADFLAHEWDTDQLVSALCAAVHTLGTSGRPRPLTGRG